MPGWRAMRRDFLEENAPLPQRARLKTLKERAVFCVCRKRKLPFLVGGHGGHGGRRLELRGGSWYELAMLRPVRMLFFAMIAGLFFAAPALAQSSEGPSANGVAQQFNSGANRVGQGATQIGKGIAQGAIMTWQAVRNGATAFAHRFSGDQADTPHNRNQ